MKLCPKCQKQFSDDANFCPVDASRLVSAETQSATADALAAKFQLGDQLGGSRTGAVYRAVDKATGQAAAVKIIAPAVVAIPGLAQRLERELKQLERVQTAGVAKILAAGKRGDDTWLALELLDGAQTLSEAISARGPIPYEQAAGLIEIIGEALIEAAQVGVVHRDLAPKNILFAGGDVKLINFSLPVPPTDKAAGVPEFVAPEQHDGKPVDQRSNLYSLGALYYFVLTGQPVQFDDGAVRPPSQLAPVPAPVDAVILRALDRSPTKRFLTVRQFVDEVHRVSGEAEPPAAEPVPARPAAEVVSTLVGVTDGTVPMFSSGPVATVPSSSGPIAAAAADPSASQRSPWAPPQNLGPRGAAPIPTMPMPTTAGGLEPMVPLAPASTSPLPVAAPLVPVSTMPMPTIAPAAVAAPVVAAPVVASPLLAAKRPTTHEESKGKFRETMWFKKGELDAQAAQAAAEEHARTGRIATTGDKSDLMPIDERYKDDGSLSRSDKERFSLRTGGTAMTKAHRATGGAVSVSKVSEEALIGELKRGRNKVFAAIALAVVVIAAIIFLIVR
jgi:serine/threonine protein kinase